MFSAASATGHRQQKERSKTRESVFQRSLLSAPCHSFSTLLLSPHAPKPTMSTVTTMESFTAATTAPQDASTASNSTTAPTTARPCLLMQSLLHDAVEDLDSLDPMSRQLREEAIQTAQAEPELRSLLYHTVLAPGVRTFEEAVATTVTYRLLLRPCNQPPAMNHHNDDNNYNSGIPPPAFCPFTLRGIVAEALTQNADDGQSIREAGHLLSEAVRQDAQVVVDRDPAVDTLLEVVLFLKGFAALVCHRAAYYKWHKAKQINPQKKSMVALWLQSQASAVFGLDIHPAATLGAGILMDHGTGIVIGETATVGDGCTLLHGVTLGGTGKDSGDRHPKVGQDVLIGANASLLGNIRIGDGAKIGAGSVVLRPIPSHATAVGAPAKIVGRAREDKPASTMDETLQNVHQLHKSISNASNATLDTAASSSKSTATAVSTSVAMDAAKAASEYTSSDEDEADDSDDVDFNNSSNEQKMHAEQKANDTNHKSSKKACNTDMMCPFRHYARMAALAPPSSITFATLEQLLLPQGCKSSNVGEIFFALDKRDVGYIKPKDLLTPEARQLLVEKTGLTEEKVDSLLGNLNEKLVNNTRQRTQSVRTSRADPVPRDIPLTA